jgi:hypothetical protein
MSRVEERWPPMREVGKSLVDADSSKVLKYILVHWSE